MYEKFETLLKENNVTPYRVHKETGISTATLSDWKNGKSEPKKIKSKKYATISRFLYLIFMETTQLKINHLSRKEMLNK